jgi:hypothetical protein
MSLPPRFGGHRMCPNRDDVHLSTYGVLDGQILAVAPFAASGVLINNTEYGDHRSLDLRVRES